MEKEEKVKEKDVKKQEFLGVKLKLGVLVGKRGGNTTPSPTWRYGLSQADVSRPQHITTATISARKLGANLWEVQPHLETSTGVPLPRSQHRKSKSKGRDSEIPNQFGQPSDTQKPQKQATTATDLRKHFVQPTMQHHGLVERNDDAIPPVSPGSSSTMEMTPYRPSITPNGSPYLKGRSRDSSYNLKTSTELVKILNRIWSLEEQHTSNISLVKAMKKELDHARGQIRELLQEKKRHFQEMDDMMRHLAEDKVVRKQIEDSQVKDVIWSMRNEVEDERKLRKHSERLHRKLARELSDVKSSFSNALKELERERKARMLLEDLCDEFAKGIRDYEQEIHLRKNRFEKDWTTRDRLIIHLSEAWLDERMQMKLAETHSGFADRKTIVDKLSFEIETFLKTRKSVSSVDDMLSARIPTGSNLRRCSLESFHLNEPGSAPQNGIDEEDFVGSALYSSEVKRSSTPKQSNGSVKQQNEYAPNDHVAKIAKSNHTKKKFQSGEDEKDSDLLVQQMQSEEQFLGDVSHNGNESHLMNMEPAQTRGGNPAELTVFQTTEVDEVLGKNSPRKEYKEKENHDDLPNNRIRDPFSSECKQHHENNRAENCFDPSSFSGTAYPVEKWTSKALAPHFEASESSSRWHQGVKENTLKAKLLEARLESQHSRSRTSKIEQGERLQMSAS